MPPVSSTTQELKSPLAYKIRTMAGDVDALKKGSGSLHSEITINPTLAPPNANQLQIKPSFPNIGQIKQEIKKPEISINSQLPRPLVSPPPLSPRPQPFETPIKKPIMPPENLNQQQRIQAPPPGLPTEPAMPRPTAPMPPPRPLTPPPIQQQAPKLPPLPPLPTFRPNLPPLPPIPLKQASAPYSQPKKGGKGKLVLIITISVLILVFVAGEIWWFFLRQMPTTQVNTQNILPPPQELQPLLPINPTPTINTTSETQTSADLLYYDSAAQTVNGADITKINTDVVEKNTLVKLTVQKSEIDSTTGEPLAVDVTMLDEIIKLLKIKIPTTVKNQLSSEFDVFAFGGNEAFDKIECGKIKNSSASCYGPRLGLAIKVLDPEKISAPLKTWEKTMVTDLKPLVLSTVGVAASPTFQTGTYQDQTIHYKNLPLNTITIEYALVNDILIITTSKSAMLKAIDSSIITNQ